MKKPNFFIVGAPKCATSALYQNLRLHPDIFMAQPKEVNFFSTDLVSPHFLTSEEKYLDLFASATTQKRLGEASVWYLYSKEAAERIKQFNPDAKIIAMVRNPVDMIYSYHSQRIWNGTEDISDFKKAVAAIPSRMQGENLPHDPYPIKSLDYLNIAKYHDQLLRYFNAFGRENVYVIVFDDYSKDKELIFRNTLEFLGVDPNFKPNLPDTALVRNSNRRVKSDLAAKFLNSPPPLLLKLGKLFLPSKNIRENLWQTLFRANADWKDRDPMDPQQGQELKTYFKPEVESLSKLLDRDLLKLWNY